MVDKNRRILTKNKYTDTGDFIDGVVNCEKGIYPYTLNTKGIIIKKNIIPNLLKKVFFGIIINIGITFFVFRVNK